MLPLVKRSGREDCQNKHQYKCYIYSSCVEIKWDRVIYQSTNTITEGRVGPGVTLTEIETICTHENVTRVENGEPEGDSEHVSYLVQREIGKRWFV